MYQQAMTVGSVFGLMYKRLKWRIAEHNRILACREQLIQKGLTRQAEKAIEQHRGAIDELARMLKAEYPDWGGERDITEPYAEWDTSLGIENYTVWLRTKGRELFEGDQSAIP